MNTAAVSMNTQREMIMSFPMRNVISRYSQDHPTLAAQSALHEQELKRYLYLCAKYPQQGWPMVNSLDELWHTFIIFTKDYHHFCQQLGLDYIHHQPFNDGEDTSEVPAAYQQFLALYRQEFGDPPGAVWPKELSGNDCSSCGSGCSGGGCSGSGCGSSCGSSCR